jgi:hypothetical protein
VFGYQALQRGDVAGPDGLAQRHREGISFLQCHHGCSPIRDADDPLTETEFCLPGRPAVDIISCRL